MDATPIRYRQQGHLNILQIEILSSVIVIIEEAISCIICSLILAVVLEFLGRQVSFQSIWSPIACGAAWSAILIRNDLQRSSLVRGAILDNAMSDLPADSTRNQ